MSMTKPLLKQSELFKGVSPEELMLLTPLTRSETFSTGSIVFFQDAPAEKAYLLDHGLVALKTSLSDGVEITYEMITHRGDLFGWSALVEPFQLTATAICLEKTKVLELNRKDLNQLFSRYPRLGFKVMQNLCVLIARRLQRTRQILTGEI
jgi:CRP/FNR family transcriptional regulator, cyclic AMP receptor protein